MPKILQLIQSCGECPHHKYYSANQYECLLTGEIVQNKNVVASFCPLADFPSRALADQERTIQVLREPRRYTLAAAVLSHLGTKLNLNLEPSGRITLKTTQGESILLMLDHITEITTSPWTIYFLFDGKNYKLYPDGQKPELYLSVKLPGSEKEGWQQYHLENSGG